MFHYISIWTKQTFQNQKTKNYSEGEEASSGTSSVDICTSPAFSLCSIELNHLEKEVTKLQQIKDLTNDTKKECKLNHDLAVGSNKLEKDIAAKAPDKYVSTIKAKISEVKTLSNILKDMDRAAKRRIEKEAFNLKSRYHMNEFWFIFQLSVN